MQDDDLVEVNLDSLALAYLQRLKRTIEEGSIADVQALVALGPELMGFLGAFEDLLAGALELDLGLVDPDAEPEPDN